MKVFGLIGHPGSGKTSLMLLLLPLLAARGLSVSTIQEAPAEFDVDKPGKDSFRHREAGATEVMLASGPRWALMHENRAEPEPGLDQMLARLEPVDLVLVEGFAHWPHPRIEVWRQALGLAPQFAHDPLVAAVASPDRPAGLALPLLPLNDAGAVAQFLIEKVAA